MLICVDHMIVYFTDGCFQFSHQWLASFTDGAYRCHIENIITFSSVEDIVCSSEELCGSGVIHAGCSVISEAMTEKKNHEVEIMSEAVVALFRYCRADTVSFS